MKKILYIATTADKRNRLDGETVKCKLLREFLNDIDDVKILSVDTDNWKKHIFKLIFLILINYFKCDDIIVSSADKGAHIVLNFFRKIHCKKTIYYFVIGGSLYKNISEKKWNVKTYKKIKKIYVEAEILKNNLESISINNVEVLNNFRKVKKYKNNYKKSDHFKFVYFGRVIKEKGIEEAIKLIKKLNSEKYDCTLDIYGQCSDDYLKIIEPMFTKNIVYHGEIKPDCKTEYEILSKFDAFLFPTEYPGECLPGALIDSYIAGLAVLASNWKYAKEYIEDGKNGFIFEYKNYDDMYVKAKQLLNSEKLTFFKEYSKKLSERYDLDNLLKEFREEIKC